MDRVTITGPFNATGPAIRRRAGRSSSASLRVPASEGGCAKQIIATLARRAYRQPVKDADLQPILDFYKSARRDGTFERGIESALQLILASPKFVFRVEHDPPNVPPGGIYRISDVELASRLSFFLWSSIPDDELLDGREPGQAERPRRSSISRCAGCWPIRNRRRSSPTSPGSGCSCAT